MSERSGPPVAGAPSEGVAITRLTFVWNADFDLAGGLRALREVLAGRHECTLCAIAYHRVTQTDGWKDYKHELTARLGVQIREPCRNQLTDDERAAASDDFPAVLARTAAGVAKLLGSADIDACEGRLVDFRAKLDAAIAAHAVRAAATSPRRDRATGR